MNPDEYDEYPDTEPTWTPDVQPLWVESPNYYEDED